MSAKISQKSLKEELHYNPKTGVFTWLHNWPNARAGDAAGRICPQGYRYINIAGDQFSAQRLAVLYMTGSMPGRGIEVDHKNHDRDDNRWVNLRIGTKSENMQNRKGAQANGSTGFRGVSFNKKSGKYEAYALYNGRQKRFGWFETAEQADEVASLARAMTMPTSKDAASQPVFYGIDGLSRCARGRMRQLQSGWPAMGAPEPRRRTRG